MRNNRFYSIEIHAPIWASWESEPQQSVAAAVFREKHLGESRKLLGQSEKRRGSSEQRGIYPWAKGVYLFAAKTYTSLSQRYIPPSSKGIYPLLARGYTSLTQRYTPFHPESPRRFSDCPGSFLDCPGSFANSPCMVGLGPHLRSGYALEGALPPTRRADTKSGLKPHTLCIIRPFPTTRKDTRIIVYLNAVVWCWR